MMSILTECVIAVNDKITKEDVATAAEAWDGPGVGETPGQRIAKLRKLRGISRQGDLGALLDPPRDTQYVHRVEKGQDLSYEEALQFAKALDATIGDILDGAPRVFSVPLVGYVGAGDLYSWDAVKGPWVGFDVVQAPFGDVIAVIVRGDSMAPTYRNGDMLTFKKADHPHEAFIGQDCLVQVRGGQAYLKLVEPGSRSGRYDLRSFDRRLAVIKDAEIEWAAPIGWMMRGKR